MKYAKQLSAVTIMIIGAVVLFMRNEESLTEKTIKYNNTVYSECFVSTSTGTDTERYRVSTECWKSKRRNTPDDLYLTVPKYLVDEGKCSISQTEDQHVRQENGGMYATDLACNFKEQGVYAPDYLDQIIEYKIESVGYDNLLGNFIILSFIDSKDNDNTQIRWYFGHTVLDSKLKIGDIIHTGVRFGSANISGATTGWHTHIELRRMYDGVWQSVRYVTRGKERKLEEKRLGGMASGVLNTSSGSRQERSNLDTYYFTHYVLGDTKQNDDAPCISADGKDSCLLQKHGRGTMALTVDIRKKMNINFGDKVALTGDVGCEGVYTVTDEMSCRFRGEYAWSNGACYYSDGTPTPKVSNILRPGTPYYIKGDLPGRPGGACSISKL